MKTATPDTLTRNALQAACNALAPDATLADLKTWADLKRKPRNWTAATKNAAVLAWYLGQTAAPKPEPEPAPVDPQAVTLAALAPKGDPAAPAIIRDAARGKATAADLAAPLVTLATYAGHGGLSWVTGKKPGKPTTGTAAQAARVVAVATLRGAVYGHPARLGESSDPAAVTVRVGGGFYHVTPAAAQRDPVAFVPAEYITAAAALGYNLRPWHNEKDNRGRDRRKADKPRTYLVRVEATEKKEAHAVAVKGYPLANVALAIVSARPGKEARKRAHSGIAGLVRSRGLLAVAAAVRKMQEADAGTEASHDEVVSGVLAWLAEQRKADGTTEGCSIAARTGSRHNRKVEQIKEAAKTLSAAAAPARRTRTRKAGKKAGKKA